METDYSRNALNVNNPLLALDYSYHFNSDSENIYTKGCKWAPDGSCLLVGNSDKMFRILNLPSIVSSGNFTNEEWLSRGWIKSSKPALTIAENEDIYDYCWYPRLKSDDLKTFCFLSSCRDLPIHLWDAKNGKLQASYLAYDHLDQMVPAYSICFSNDGCYIIAGYDKSIRIFDILHPGKNNVSVKCENILTRVSSVASHPELPTIFAAASYNGSIGLFSSKFKKCFALLKGHEKGITYLKFSNDGSLLFSGTRKDDEILCWDVRNPGNIFASFKRQMTNNQRMYFDFTPCNQHLLSGTTDGSVLSWKLNYHLASLTGSNDPSDVQPDNSFKAHNDCCNGISIHPFCPILATSSGKRHQKRVNHKNDSDSEEMEIISESTVKLWWLADVL